MASLRDLRQQNRDALAEADRISEASRGRNKTDEEQRTFDAALATAERTSAEIDTLVDGAVADEDAGRSPVKGNSSSAFLDSYLKARADMVSGAHASATATAPRLDREADRNGMRAECKRAGMTARVDPGAGLSPSQASMARTLASMGITPRAA